jgi:hypothetical protein
METTTQARTETKMPMFITLRPRRMVALSLLLSAAACATNGLPDDPVLKEYEPKRWVGTPKSGLRVIVQEDHSAPLVSIVTSFGVGATSDPKGMEGLAHFIEHLVFRSKPFGEAGSTGTSSNTPAAPSTPARHGISPPTTRRHTRTSCN